MHRLASPTELAYAPTGAEVFAGMLLSPVDLHRRPPDHFEEQFSPVDKYADINWHGFPAVAEEVALDPDPIDWHGFPLLVEEKTVDYLTLIKEDFAGPRVWLLFTELEDGSYVFDREHDTRRGVIHTGLRVPNDKGVAGGIWYYQNEASVGVTHQVIRPEVIGEELERAVGAELLKLCFTRIL